MIRKVVLFAFAAVLLLPATSLAASRYAAPQGSGTDCSVSLPCSLPLALIVASSGDDIIVGPGEYGEPNSPLIGLTDEGKTLHIIGQTQASTGQQIPDRPLVYVAVNSPWSLPQPGPGGSAGLVLSGSGSSISDVAIQGYAVGGNLNGLLALTGPKTSADRVMVKQTVDAPTGGNACLVAMPTVAGGARSAIRDSICATRSNSSSSNAVFALAGDGAVLTVRNSTFSTRGGAGLQVVTTAGSMQTNVHNSILHGGGHPDWGWDVGSFTQGGFSYIKLTNSNYATRLTSSPGADGVTPLITDPTTNGNQTAPPVFEDEANSDFHPAAGSPTIDAGAAPASPLDLDGQSRSTGTGPDIGAYEFISPTNVVVPTISGFPYRGKTLTADPGVWLGHQPIAYTYQWQRCNASGSSCSNIPGASQATYVVTSAEVGGTIRVRVTATNSDGAASIRSAATQKISTYVDVITGDGPLAYWRLGDASNSTVMADSAGHYPGTYANQAGGSPYPGISGDGNTTGLFTGTGTYGYVNNLPAPPREYSVEAWVRQEDSSGAASIFQQGGGGALWINSDGHPVFTQVNTNVVDTSTTIQPGRWYHIVGTWDRFRARVYVDGHETASASSSTAPSGSSTVYLAYGDKVPWLRGYLDEVALYGFALSASQVLTHFNADPPAFSTADTTPGDPPGPDPDPADPDPSDPDPDPKDPDPADPGNPVKPGNPVTPRSLRATVTGLKAKVRRGKVVVTYNLSAKAWSTLSVKRGKGRTYKVASSRAGSGTNRLTWNRKLSGRSVRSGKVTLIVTANRNGKRTRATITVRL